MRTAIEGTGAYTPVAMIASQVRVASSPTNWPRLLLAVFSGLGVLPLLVAVRARETAAFLGANPLWLRLESVYEGKIEMSSYNRNYANNEFHYWSTRIDMVKMCL